jgi:diacylglycerol O-acyltransferase
VNEKSIIDRAVIPDSSDANFLLDDYPRELTPFETLMFKNDVDPRMRSTISAIYLLDQVPDFDKVRRRFDAASRMLPRLRQRVVLPALPVTPAVWAIDPDFDIDQHVRRIALAAPGSMRQLLDLAQAEAMAGLDRGRPLWRTLVVEGVEGGGAAMIQVGHHAVADGIGGIQLAMIIFDLEREGDDESVLADPPAGEFADPLSLVRGAMAPHVVARRTGATLAAAADALLSPQKYISDMTKAARSLARMRAVGDTPPPPLMSGRSSRWQFSALEFPLWALKAAAATAGGTVNDGFLAGIAGGVRLYHERRGATVGDIAIAMPISTRSAGDSAGGNHWSGTVVAVPTTGETAARVAGTHSRVKQARAAADDDSMGMLAPMLNLIPQSVMAAMASSARGGPALQASNIPGSPVPLFIGGAEITHMLPFGPLPGVAAMVVMTSHVGICCVGINADAAAVDALEFEDCLLAGFDEVLTLAGGSAKRVTTNTVTSAAGKKPMATRTTRSAPKHRSTTGASE